MYFCLKDGVDFIDNYFGSILNVLGKRELDVQTEKVLFKAIFVVIKTKQSMKTTSKN